MRTQILLLVAVMLSFFSTRYTLAVVPTPAELGDARQWTAARFADATPFFSFTYDGKPSAEGDEDVGIEAGESRPGQVAGSSIRSRTRIRRPDWCCVAWAWSIATSRLSNGRSTSRIRATRIRRFFRTSRRSTAESRSVATSRESFTTRPAASAGSTTTLRRWRRLARIPASRRAAGSARAIRCGCSRRKDAHRAECCRSSMSTPAPRASSARSAGRATGPRAFTAPTRRSTCGPAMSRTHLKLLPGEEIRSPKIALLFWGTDRMRGHNLLRQFILARHSPQKDGKPARVPVSFATWGGNFAKKHIAHGKWWKDNNLPLDFLWVDAGVVRQGRSQGRRERLQQQLGRTGRRLVSRTRAIFPRGLARWASR